MPAAKLPPTKPRLASVNQLCAALCIGRTKAYELMDKGEIAYLMLGGVRRIPVTEIDRIERKARRDALL